MPVIRISKSDLERLVGKPLGIDEIMDMLPRIKCEVGTITEEGEIEYEATHDRPDLYSVEGVARALRGLLGLEMHRYEFVDEGARAYAAEIPRRPYIAFAIVRDLELDDEAVKQIMQLQEKLATTYGRNRRKASIGVYDLDKFAMPVYYELRDPISTRFIPLEEAKEMSLQEILVETEKGRMFRHLLHGWEKYPVIRDKKGRILSMPPIINSEDTKVTTETRNVLIDSTGLDEKTVVDMVTVMATSIAERSATGRIVFVTTIYPDGRTLRAPRPTGPEVIASVKTINELLGTSLSRKEMIELLGRMGYTVEEMNDEYIRATAPPYRLDIHNYTDLAEDIAIAYGYEKIGVEAVGLPPATHPGRLHPLEFISRLVRRILVGYGFIEVANYMMSSPAVQFEMLGIEDMDMIMVSNPKMDKYTGLRRWLTPGLLEALFMNYEKRPGIRIFEVGDVAIPDKSTDTGARTERRLGILITREKTTLTDGIAIINAVLNRLGLTPRYEKTRVPGYLPQRTAKIIVGEEEIGFVGEIDPCILYKQDIDNPVVVGEIILDKLLSLIS